VIRAVIHVMVDIVICTGIYIVRYVMVEIVIDIMIQIMTEIMVEIMIQIVIEIGVVIQVSMGLHIAVGVPGIIPSQTDELQSGQEKPQDHQRGKGQVIPGSEKRKDTRHGSSFYEWMVSISATVSR
jgi:hypothetical protein